MSENLIELIQLCINTGEKEDARNDSKVLHDYLPSRRTSA